MPVYPPWFRGLSLTQHYTSLAKLFHWLTAVAVLGMIGLGWFMTSLEFSPLMLKLFSWHKWIGICILLVTVLRLIWRFSHPAPPLPDDMPPVLRLGAHAGHIMLYALLIGLPIAGWIHSSAAGFPVVWFSVIPLPNLVGPSKQISDVFSWLHWAGGLMLVALLVAHIGAAIWHHKIKKDDILVRMLPGRSSLTAVVSAMLLVAVSPRLEAAPLDVWIVDPETSKIGFTAKQMNVPVKGTFNTYTATIVFDAEQLDKSSIKLEFQTASIATGNPEADQALPSADWFSASAHPTAAFTGDDFKPVGEGKYEISGKLTIKGTTSSVTIMASISTSEDPQDPSKLTAQASGEATISRTAFKVGEGQWASTATIADEVIISFNISAQRAK